MLLLKQVSTLLFTFAVSVTLFAQTEKGTFLVGADFKLRDFDISKRGDNKYLRYNAGLETGYFFKDKWILGGELGFIHISSRNSDGVGYSAENLNAGLFTGRYFNLKNPKWKPFVEVGGGIINIDMNQKSLSTVIDYPSGSWINGYFRVEAGIAYFVRQNLSLTLSENHQYVFHKGGYNTLGGLRFGVRYHFGPKN